MSHTFNVKIELHDKKALENACRRLGLKIKEDTYYLFSSTEIGLGITLKDWSYPIVIKQDGSVAYDNYNGRWGNISKLHELEAYYGLEKAKIEAQNMGYSVYESQDENDNLILKIQVGE